MSVTHFLFGSKENYDSATLVTSENCINHVMSSRRLIAMEVKHEKRYGHMLVVFGQILFLSEQLY